VVLLLIWAAAFLFSYPRMRIRVFCLGLLCLESGELINIIATLVYGFTETKDSSLPTVVTSIVIIILILKELISWLMAQKQKQDNVALAASTVQDGHKMSNQEGVAAIDEIARNFSLTKREAEIVPYLVRGRGADYIAKELFIQPTTVKSHVGHIYRKIGIRGRRELMDLVERWVLTSE
jgi:DNA-binding CsgD family transcriptional regulator